MLYFSLPVRDNIKLVQTELAMAEELYSVIQQNLSYLMRRLSTINDSLTLEDERDFIKMRLEAQAHNQARLLMICDGSRIIGTMELRDIDRDTCRATIGYWIAEAYSGQGITTECLKVLCRFAFKMLGLKELHLYAEVTNIGSNKVAQKCGFEWQEKKERYDKNLQGDDVDVNFYRLFRKDGWTEG